MKILELQEYLRQKDKICCADLQLERGMSYQSAKEIIGFLLELEWLAPLTCGVYHTVLAQNLHLREFEERELAEITGMLNTGDVRLLRKLSPFYPKQKVEFRLLENDEYCVSERLDFMEELGLVHHTEHGYRSCISDKASLTVFRLSRRIMREED